MNDYLKKGFSRVTINYENIILSMEGKIIMEEYGRQFRFLKHTMKNAFKDFSLASALNIYITS